MTTDTMAAKASKPRQLTAMGAGARGQAVSRTEGVRQTPLGEIPRG